MLEFLEDLAKAFHTAHHCFVLQKLELYGVKSVAFHLLKSYLEAGNKMSTL